MSSTAIDWLGFCNFGGHMPVRSDAMSAAAPADYALRWVRGRDAVAAVQPHWSRLFESSYSACPESAWPFVAIESEASADSYQPLVLSVMQAGEVVGFLPFLEPKKKLMGGKKVVRGFGFESTTCGRMLVPNGSWSAIEAELRDYLANSPFESLAMRRVAHGLEPGAYVTEFARTKVLRKVQSGGNRLKLTQPLEVQLNETAQNWLPAYASASLRHSFFDEVGDAIRLLQGMTLDRNQQLQHLVPAILEEGDGFVAWLESDAKVVAAQLFVQTRNTMLALQGGGVGLTCLQWRVFQAAMLQGVESVIFSQPNPDWHCVPVGNVEDYVIVRQ